MSNQLAGVHDTDVVLSLIVNEAARLVGVSAAALWLLEGDALEPSAQTDSYREPQDRLTFVNQSGTSLVGHAMATKKPMVTEDVQENEFFTAEGRLHARENGYFGAVVIPLLADDRSIGVLLMFDTRVRRFTDDEVSLLTAFADQASLALEKARMLNDAESRERQATQLYEVTKQLASNHDLESVLDLIAQQSADLLGATSVVVYQFDESKGGLIAVNTFNLIPESKGAVLMPGEGIGGRAYQQEAVAWTSDFLADVEDSSILYANAGAENLVRRQVAEDGSRSGIAAPIMISDHVWGVLGVTFSWTREFTDEEMNLVQNLADSAAVAINNARFIEETEQARDEAEDANRTKS